MKVIWFVLATGCRWEDVPGELGCSGRTAHRRLRKWEEMGVSRARLHVHLLTLLRKAGQLDTKVTIVDSVIVRAFRRGEDTGPSPVDRGKPGTKQALMVDANGVSPWSSAARVPTSVDQTEIIPTVLDFPEDSWKAR